MTSLGNSGQSGRYDSKWPYPVLVALLLTVLECLTSCSCLTEWAAYDSGWKGILTCCMTYRGVSKETRGTAYIVYEDIYDAKTAVEHLSGFNVANRYLIVLYYNTAKQNKKASAAHSCCDAHPTADVSCSQASVCTAEGWPLILPDPLSN